MGSKINRKSLYIHADTHIHLYVSDIRRSYEPSGWTSINYCQEDWFLPKVGKTVNLFTGLGKFRKWYKKSRGKFCKPPKGLRKVSDFFCQWSPEIHNFDVENSKASRTLGSICFHTYKRFSKHLRSSLDHCIKPVLIYLMDDLRNKRN